MLCINNTYFHKRVPNGCSLPVLNAVERIGKGKSLSTPTFKEEYKLLQKIMRFFEKKGEKVGYSMDEWNKIQVLNCIVCINSV